MAFRDDLIAGQAAIWAQFGDPAIWNGAPCLVCRDQPDQVIRFGKSRAVVGTVMLEVRRVEVDPAAEGDVVVINPDTAPESFTVIGTPLGDGQKTTWLCQAKPTP